MKDISNLPRNLPDRTHKFSIEVEGVITKHKYHGDFSCTIPTIGVQGQISRHKGFLTGGITLDPAADNFFTMISYLKYALREPPEWWIKSDGGHDLFDVNVIEEIYTQAIKFENSWVKTIWGEEDDKGE